MVEASLIDLNKVMARPDIDDIWLPTDSSKVVWIKYGNRVVEVNAEPTPVRFSIPITPIEDFFVYCMQSGNYSQAPVAFRVNNTVYMHIPSEIFSLCNSCSEKHWQKIDGTRTFSYEVE